MLYSIFLFLATGALSNWAWIGGSQTTNPPPSNIGLFMEAPSVTPGDLSAMGYLINSSYIITLGGYNSVTNSHSNIWRYNLSSGMWSLIFFSNSPTAAYGIKGVFANGVVPTPMDQRMVLLDTVMNSLFSFGGYVDRGIHDNNMFEFNLDLNQWRWIHGPGVAGDSGSYGERGVESPLNVPPGRYSQAYFYDKLTRRIYIYGGFTVENGQRHSSDHWMYSIVNNTWTWIHGSAEPEVPGVYGEIGVGTAETRPGSRASPCFTFDHIARKFYMFGGLGTTVNTTRGFPTDLWSYEPDRNVWTWLAGNTDIEIQGNYGARGVAEPGMFPRSRIGSTMVFEPNSRKLYLFSGMVYINMAEKIMNDLWIFDLESLMWTWLAGASSFGAAGRYGPLGVASPSNNPPARYVASMTLYNSTLYMFGGRRSSAEGFGDLWAYSLDLDTSQPSKSSSSRGTTLRRNFVSSSGSSNEVNIAVYVAVSVLIVVASVVALLVVIRRRKFNNSEKLSLIGGNSQQTSTTTTRSALNGTATHAPTSMGLSLPGHLLVRESDFRCGKLLASGGGGDVYRGEAIGRSVIKLCRDIVVKRPKISNNASFKLFEQEISIMYLLLGSQFVAKIVGFSTEPPTLLMKLYPDGSLISFFTKRLPKRKWNLRFSLHIASGLRDIHRTQIAHCDMKPPNVLIDRDAKGRPFCVITDFGIAQILSEKLLILKYSEAVSVRGFSVQYAAPEVFLRFRNKLESKAPQLLKSGDVYALGMIIKFLLTGKEPWD